jgi:hypothetical protein
MLPAGKICSFRILAGHGGADDIESKAYDDTFVDRIGSHGSRD